ncbi:MAG: transcriptional repressor [Planctomycetia bacterium]|nr:transcriptional repressor [Planctomycetia bacterium]
MSGLFSIETIELGVDCGDMKAQKPLAHDAVKARIRAVGLRCTAARLTVMQHLMAASGPETHAEVSDALADRSFDRATIYRNLTELTEAKLVTRVELGDHVWRFELKRPGKAGSHGEDHPHFLCTKCGEVSCLDDVTVAITPKPVATGMRASFGAGKPKAATHRSQGIRSVTEVLLKGECNKCG